MAARACFGLGEFAAARGQTDLSVTYYESAGEELAEAGDRTWLPWRSGLARILAARGEIATATGLVEEELAEARVLDSPYAVASALRTMSAVAPTDRRVELLDEALALLAGGDAARLEAQIRTDLAGWLLLLQPTESAQAVDLLRSAEKYARQEDLAPLLGRIRWLLERLGEAPDGELRRPDVRAQRRRAAGRRARGRWASATARSPSSWASA